MEMLFVTPNLNNFTIKLPFLILIWLSFIPVNIVQL